MNIPLFKVFMSEDAIKDLEPVLSSGYIGQGPRVEEFEEKLRNYIQSPYVNTLNSGTSGLHLALHMLKYSGEDTRNEILTTPVTCTATNWPILALDLKLKWVDVDPKTCNVDLVDLERKIDRNTLGIMVVHWGGYPCDLDELRQIQIRAHQRFGYTPPIIEDCAHALGATYREKRIGSHGNHCMFSFQAIKHLTTGDGGMLVSPTNKTYKRAKLLRWYGLDRTTSADFRCVHPNTKVKLFDNTTCRISKLVKEKSKGPVLVHNGKSLISGNIIGWHKNDLGNRHFLKVTTVGTQPYSSIVTNDHLLLTQGGWKRSDELVSLKDMVATSYSSPSSRQRKIIVGSLLGDAGLTVKGKKIYHRATLTERHTAIDRQYVELKAKSLKGLGAKVGYSQPDSTRKRPNGCYYYYTTSSPSLYEFQTQFYSNGKKIVPIELVENEFSDLMLACWFLDDGYTKVVNQREGLVYFSQIATNSFSEKEVQDLVDLLNKKGYECNKKNHSGWRIFFSKNGSHQLLQTISRYVPPSLRYKVGHHFDPFDESLWGDGSSETYFDKVIVSEHSDDYKSVYCLTIDGHSNFATSSVIVHNCEQTIQEWGYKFQMNDIAASIGLSNMVHLDWIVGTHQFNGHFYDDELQGVPGVQLLECAKDRESSYWIYTMRVERRDDFVKKMRENGIGVSRVHDRNDKHDCVWSSKVALPGTDEICEDMICIPCGWWVGEPEREYIVDCIKKGW